MQGVKATIAIKWPLQGDWLGSYILPYFGGTMYYEIDRTLSYGALFNLVNGGRGIGKSYGWKKKAIRDFLKYGKQFGYIRRYQSEIETVQESLFNDIMKNDEFPGHLIKYEKGVWTVDDEEAGYPFALTATKDYKSSSFPNVYNLLFDEYIIEKGRSGYLKNEPNKLLDLYETIARSREGVILFMFANAITMNNPYTLAWDLYLPKNKRVYKRPDIPILFELAQTSAEFKEMKEQTAFGKISRALGYAEYAVDNKFYLDSESVILKKGKNTRFYFKFVWKGKTYGVWFDNDSGYVIVSYDLDPYSTLTFTVDKDSINGTVAYVKQYEKHPYFKRLKEAFYSNNLGYESEKIQTEIKGMLEFII